MTSLGLRLRGALAALQLPGRSHAAKRHVAVVPSGELTALSGCSPQDALHRLRCSPNGLSLEDAEARLAAVGPNVVARNGHPGILRELIGRSKNPLNALLLTLALVSYLLGDLRAAIVISVIVILATATAFVQEHRSNNAAAKLRAMVKTTASVRRCDPVRAAAENGFAEIPIEEIVPGDIVGLSAGDMIPADIRLLSTKDLFVNQSALTGEAMPVEKFADTAKQSIDDPFQAGAPTF